MQEISYLEGEPQSCVVLPLRVVGVDGGDGGDGAVGSRAGVYVGIGKTELRVIEVIKGWLTLKELDGAVGVMVTPLDGSGKALTEVRGRRLEVGWEISVGDQVATSYLVRVIR
jgi:hypothetical protein